MNVDSMHQESALAFSALSSAVENSPNRMLGLAKKVERMKEEGQFNKALAGVQVK
jgi:hypothetical protein